MTEEFPGQQKKEKLIKILRKHPIALSGQIFKFLIFFVPAILLIIFVNKDINIFSNYINIFALVLLLFSFSYAFYAWVTWYYDLYILTDRRVIEVDQRGVFSREVKEIALDRIEDVTYSVSGILKTVFDIGSVRVRSGSGQHITMEYLAKPSVVREVVVKLAESGHKKHNTVEDLAAALLKSLKK